MSYKIKEIRSWSDEELEKKLEELKAEQLNQRMLKVLGGAIENPARIRNTRRTIARILTVMNERKKRKEESEDRKDKQEKT
ncbi:MAG: 50S ribosomal protein L29 [Candidatus Freyarchaeota archaeon]|nr:50S ribosomal protein L29 [Candidatus Jordarchaeia archaeon]